ncbi:hypothetical protein EVAR_66693_1 [Eumeta japonica]|uniref:Uncharacterized protein n=1 Tax=Eumeta variegata TaxID=151549 RepID=A0A4C1ZJK9_EUMVA|nr:hypothetical protein EVAR_66693_1 [Eumeta japonica]
MENLDYRSRLRFEGKLRMRSGIGMWIAATSVNQKYLSPTSSKSEQGVVAKLESKAEQRAKSRKGPETESKVGPRTKLRTELKLKTNVGTGSESKV